MFRCVFKDALTALFPLKAECVQLAMWVPGGRSWPRRIKEQFRHMTSHLSSHWHTSPFCPMLNRFIRLLQMQIV